MSFTFIEPPVTSYNLKRSLLIVVFPAPIKTQKMNMMDGKYINSKTSSSIFQDLPVGPTIASVLPLFILNDTPLRPDDFG